MSAPALVKLDSLTVPEQPSFGIYTLPRSAQGDGDKALFVIGCGCGCSLLVGRPATLEELKLLRAELDGIIQRLGFDQSAAITHPGGHA